MLPVSPNYTRAFLVSALAIAAGGCDARQRMLDAVVRQSGNAPCFSVEAEGLGANEELTVAGIQVSEIDELERTLSAPWTAGFASTPSPVQLSPETCIPYGAPDVEDRGLPAEPLIPGQRYTVFINAHVHRRDEWHNRSYTGYFCLAQRATGEIDVRQVHWNDDTSRRRWGVCGSGPVKSSPKELTDDEGAHVSVSTSKNLWQITEVFARRMPLTEETVERLLATELSLVERDSNSTYWAYASFRAGYE